MQSSRHLLMIQPVQFEFNLQTASNNTFQADPGTQVQEPALKEFNDLVQILRENLVEVTVIKDSPEPHTPDSIFPNNWISFHEDGTVFLYPMFAENRRQERKKAILDLLREKFFISTIQDLSKYETEHLFLEGTGSMVLDRDNRIAYTCNSPRSDQKILDEFCRIAGYRAISFNAKDEQRTAIYHTNVMMSVADQFAVICVASIPLKTERNTVLNSLSNTHKEIIEISLEQMAHFAGNVLQVRNKKDESLLVMSTRAYRCLSNEQVNALKKYNRLIYSNLETIESAGGGSARCMIAEIFNKER